MRAAALLGALVFLGAAACGEEGPEAGPCLVDSAEDPARAARELALLRGTEEGRRLLARVGAAPMRLCYGAEQPAVLAPGGVLRLDRRQPEPESAARVGHLLLHLVEGPPMGPADDGADCDARVARALDAEARAYALELSLRRALGVRAARVRFAFEAELPAGDPTEAIARWLRAHPDSGEGVAPLGRGYREACARAVP